MRVTHTTSQKWFPVLLVAMTASLSSGCSGLTSKTTGFLPKMPWTKSADETPEPYPNPVKLAVTWTPDTLVQTGRTPTRGFGGRLYFFDEMSRAVPVEGTLTIHGFDESAPKETAKVRPFEFTPEQFTKHFGQTDLGASYSIWIPWDAVGGEKAEVSLVATFKSTSGKLVQSVPAKIGLPGKVSAAQRMKTQTARFSPQYTQHQVASTSATKTSGLVTTTIPRREQSKGTIDPATRSFQVPTVERSMPTMIVDGKRATPFLDIGGTKHHNTPSIMPASAQIPVQK